MRIPESVIQTVLDKVRIEDVVSQYTQLNPKGDRLWGLSPFKTEKTPSFSVSPEKGLYYCFSTQKGGGVIQFLMEMEKFSFPEAVEHLAKSVGVTIDAQETEDPLFKEKKALEDLYNRVTNTFKHFLHSTSQGTAALQYIKSRGINEEIIELFSLGYSPNDPYWLYGFLIKKGYSPDFLKKSGLFSNKNQRWCLFTGRLMFPIQDSFGKVIAFGGRILEGDGPKYINSPETVLYKKSSILYGFNVARDSIRKKNLVHLCEGYMDVLSLHQAGINTAVAPLGTAFTEEQAKILSRFAHTAHVLFDEDLAGYQATFKALLLLERIGIEPKIITLPNGKDPGELLEKSGSQALTNAVYSTSNALDYLLKKAVSDHDIATPGGKQGAVEQLFPYVQVMGSAIKREAALEFISDRLALDIRNVNTEYSKQTTDRPMKEKKEQSSEKKGGSTNSVTSDLYLMLAVVINYQEFARIRSLFTPEDLNHPWARELYIVLEELFREGDLTTDLILSRVKEEELTNLVIQKMQGAEFNLNPQQIIDDGVRRIRMNKNLSKRKAVETSIRSLSLHDTSDSAPLLEELLKEKMFLDQELIELKVSIHDRTAE